MPTNGQILLSGTFQDDAFATSALELLRTVEFPTPQLNLNSDGDNSPRNYMGDLFWDLDLALAGAPRELDLLALPMQPAGSAAFGHVKAIVAYSRASGPGLPAVLGPGLTSPFPGPFRGAPGAGGGSSYTGPLYFPASYLPGGGGAGPSYLPPGYLPGFGSGSSGGGAPGGAGGVECRAGGFTVLTCPLEGWRVAAGASHLRIDPLGQTFGLWLFLAGTVA